MRKFLTFLLFILMLLMWACTASPQEQTQKSPEPTEKPANTPVNTEKPAASATLTSVSKETAPPLATDSPISSEPMPGCTVAGRAIEPNPTIAAIFPAISETDWVLGANDAAATFVEYGDFQ